MKGRDGTTFSFIVFQMETQSECGTIIQGFDSTGIYAEIMQKRIFFSRFGKIYEIPSKDYYNYFQKVLNKYETLKRLYRLS
jgi:hypothetical protein